MYLLGIGVTPGIYDSDVERQAPATSFGNLAEIEFCWLLIGPPWVFLGAAAWDVIQWGKPRTVAPGYR
jgi:hypothetical protein